MLWFVIVGMLAAFGALCVIWILVGIWLLPASKCTIVCLCEQRDVIQFARHYRWLQEIGMVRNSALITCDYNVALERLEKERTERDAAGNGDPPGSHQRRGVSEL